MNALVDDLQRRGVIAQSTEIEALARDLDQGPMTLYCGFDPTAPSLHLGNLLQILTVARFQRAGHVPLALVGGATGLIGDPKSSGERALNSAEIVEQWSTRVKSQLERFFDFTGPNAAQMVNNYDWTHEVSVLEFLRDIGKHFSVNRMLDREAVAARLADAGISFTEFSYQVLQAHDYLQLYRKYNCRLQTGGSDQWGNITAGTDLIRRVERVSVHALTTPLVTKSDGTKFGKTESGTIWLDPVMTTPYAFYQFWLNSDDRDVMTYARLYSSGDAHLLTQWQEATADQPHQRAAQLGLATEMTTLVHGAQATEAVQTASRALFGHADIGDVPLDTLAAALSEVPGAQVSAAEITDGLLPSIVELLSRSELVAGRGAARRTINEGGAYVNNQRITDDTWQPRVADLLGGRFLVLRRGKRTIAGVEVVADQPA
ncbi:MAG: tyrosine--tRNA ligase [Candidatus Nanopelagicales bacterium]|nr:tyrosine--tRNA ligase [Candidatus Nanopelagicales bacterium]MDP4888108.1 tyrosine--tRNA ligase [Candidatus Nanopelagicales bacterium]